MDWEWVEWGEHRGRNEEIEGLGRDSWGREYVKEGRKEREREEVVV